MDNPTLDAALSYAAAGFKVLPCHKKTPTTPNGWHDASDSKAVIRGWFKDDKAGLNVALAIPEWAVVLDIDGPQGEQSLKDHGFTPPATATVKTKRGYHYWYAWGGEQSPTRRVGFLPGVDLLCNGYALVPPSQGYSWHDVDLFSKDHIEMAPDWMLHRVVVENKFKGSSVNPDEWLKEGLPPGRKQTGLFLYACWLRGIPRMTEHQAKVLVKDLAEASNCTPDRFDPNSSKYYGKIVERVWKTYDAAEVDKQPEESRIWSLADLLVEVTDPPKYLIHNLLPAHGYSILFAAQGAGKSVLADQAAIGVATGTSFLGRDCARAGVLVLDVEQDPSGAAQRWGKLIQGMKLPAAPANLHTAFTWPMIDDGGLDKIGDFLKENPHIRLVVVDTLGQFADLDGTGGNAYFVDSRKMSRFTRFANKYDIAFLLIHHSRKSVAGQPDNFADMASGSRGITGPAKARWGLVRKEGQDHGTLMVGGKLPEAKLEITFDREYLIWR